MTWIPLEANPEASRSNYLLIARFGQRQETEYAAKLGVPDILFDKVKFVDVYGFDAELLQFVPQPIHALVLLFPVTATYESFRRQEEQQLEQGASNPLSKSLYFVKQTIPNACGTIGLLHALINGQLPSGLGEGILKKVFDKTQSKTPDERADILEKDEDIAQAHQSSSVEGQSEVPHVEDEVDLHFVCFVQSQGQLYELDGRKPCPIYHGACTNLLLDGVKVIQKFIQRDPEQMQFTAIALAPSE